MADYYNYPPPQTPSSGPTSTMAIVSLIAGIAGVTVFFGFGSIIAVITGHMAKREIRDSGGAVSGDGLATGGLVLGYIGVALLVLTICAIVASLAFGLGLPLCMIPFMNSTY